MTGRGRAAGTLVVERAIVEIAAEIQPCSVRAVCYKLFTRGLIEDMGKNCTNKISGVLTRLRERGLVPWEHIVDAGRQPDRIATFQSPEHIIGIAVRQYRRDAWREQPERLQVVVEKGTVQSTIGPVLNEFGVTCRVMKGYGSATALNDLATESASDDRPLTLLYLGDHDPSGRHMSDVDLPERIDRYGGKAEIRRIAIDVADVPLLPSFNVDTKVEDTRYRWFLEQYGRRCVELDALPPPDLRDRLTAAIVAHIEVDAWALSQRIQAAEVESMQVFHEQAKSIFRQASKYSDEGPRG